MLYCLGEILEEEKRQKMRRNNLIVRMLLIIVMVLDRKSIIRENSINTWIIVEIITVHSRIEIILTIQMKVHCFSIRMGIMMVVLLIVRHYPNIAQVIILTIESMSIYVYVFISVCVCLLIKRESLITMGRRGGGGLKITQGTSI